MTPRTLKSNSTLFSSHTTGCAYKGYSIVGNAIYGCYYVQKDGFTIATSNNLAEAKAAVDAVVG